MATSSIQVTSAVRKRLAEYKVGGMTYNDVLKILMEVLPPEDFEAKYREHQRRLVEDIRKSGTWIHSEDLVPSPTSRKAP